MRKDFLKLGQIYVDDKLYPRVAPSKKVIGEYSRDMKKGDVFPPIYVAKFKGKFYLVDGLHRLRAYELNGTEYVQVEVKDNFTSIEDIYLASVRANLKHGSRLNRNDKEKIAKTMQNFKLDIEDISKMTGIRVKKLESAITGRFKSAIIKEKIQKGELPSTLREKVKSEATGDIVDEQQLAKFREENKVEIQKAELEEIKEFFTTEKLETDNKEIRNLIIDIKRILMKKYHTNNL